MKRVLIAVSILLLASPAFATEQTSEATWKNGELSEESKGYLVHDHDYVDTDTDTDTVKKSKKTEVGVGADVVVWENENDQSLLDEVVAQYKYDIKNEDHSVYGVVRLNLWQKIKGIFGK